MPAAKPLSAFKPIPADLILTIVLLIAALCACFGVACYLFERRDRLKRAYRHVGRARRQSGLRPEMFIRDPEKYLLRSFLKGYLQVPESVLGFSSQSQLSDGDLSRLATLWAALGNDANLCYGFIDESKRHRFRPSIGSHASLWVEFAFDGESWVYWYDDAAVVDRRRDFYRNGAATILHDARYRELGSYLFKT